MIDPFNEVHLSAKDKGTFLTIDDILFASRALMADDTRTIDGGYKLLGYENDTLILNTIIDNYSS